MGGFGWIGRICTWNLKPQKKEKWYHARVISVEDSCVIGSALYEVFFYLHVQKSNWPH